MIEPNSQDEENKLTLNYGLPFIVRVVFSLGGLLAVLAILHTLYGYIDLMIEFGFLYPPFVPLAVYGSLAAITLFIGSYHETFIISPEGIEGLSGPKIWRLWQHKRTLTAPGEVSDITIEHVRTRYSSGFDISFKNQATGKEFMVARCGGEDEAKDLVTKMKLSLGSS